MGCRKVSAGCKYCYMYRWAQRPPFMTEGGKTIRRSITMLDAPLKWKEPRLVFVCNLSDFFLEEADEWRGQAWDVMRQASHHTYQILTKRPERVPDLLPPDWCFGWKNVWIGTSVEDRNTLHRIESLRKIHAYTRFVSFEPLLEEIDMTGIPAAYDWAIIGGESGNEQGAFKYRTCKQSWIKNLIQWHWAQNVPIHVKQLGTHLSRELMLKDRHGQDPTEWPLPLQIREMPNGVRI